MPERGPRLEEIGDRLEVGDDLEILVERLELPVDGGVVEVGVFSSRGLAAHGQKEIVLCLGVREGHLPPGGVDDLAKLYATFSQLAAGGQLVEGGDYSQFGPGGPLGFAGVLYLRAEVFPCLPRHADHLVGIFVHADELATAMAGGVTRAAALLGQANHFFPTPPWHDAARDPAVFAAVNEASVLSEVPTLHLRFSAVLQAGDTVKLQVGAAERERLASLHELPPAMPIALLLHLAVEADGCLVWQPKQDGPTAITPENSAGQNLGAPFLCVVPSDEGANHARLIEDGLGLFLTVDRYRALLDALQRGEPLAIELAGAPSRFELAFLP